MANPRISQVDGLGAHEWRADRSRRVVDGDGGRRGTARDRLGFARGPFWGQGYATEIGRAGLAFAFDDLSAVQVVSLTEPHNVRSRAVMERLGMTYTGRTWFEGAEFIRYVMRRSAEVMGQVPHPATLVRTRKGPA